VAEGEHAAVAAICGFLPKDVVRYCISPVSAAALLRNFETELSDGLNMASDLNVSVKQFPEVLRSYRQILRSCLRGELDRDQLPSELLSVAGSYFEGNAAAERRSSCTIVNLLCSGQSDVLCEEALAQYADCSR
jgi:hypothetical protein